MREYHSAACVGYEGQHQRLVISEGWDRGDETYADMWMLHPQSERMEKVRIAPEN